MKKTTLAWLAIHVLFGLTVFVPRVYGQCPEPKPVDVSGCFACNDTINVTLSADNCRAAVALDEVVQGGSCPYSKELKAALYVVVFDGVYPDNDPQKADGTVDRAGAFNYEVRIRPEFASCFTWQPCWGVVNAEDKSPPAVTCPEPVNGLWKEKVDDKEWEEYNGYKFDPYFWHPPVKDGDGGDPWVNIDQKPDHFNWLTCLDFDKIYNAERSWTDPRYPWYTGAPVAQDACDGARLVRVRDEIALDFETCPENPGPDVLRLIDFVERHVPGAQELLIFLRLHYWALSKAVVREFTYEDNKGNKASCYQLILFQRPFVELPECKIHLDLCVAGGDSTLTPADLVSKYGRTEAAPYFYNAVCDRIYLTDHTCNFTIDYVDQVFPGPSGCGVKITRTWTMLDWCWRSVDNYPYFLYAGRELSDVPERLQNYLCYGDYEGFPFYVFPRQWENKRFDWEQHIIVADETPPVVSCPEVKVDGQVSTTQVFSTGPFDCTAVINPAPPVVTNNECQGWTWEFELYGDVIDPKTGLIKRNQLIATSANHLVTGIGTGEYRIRYIVTDKCGNVSSLSCLAVVKDKISPVAVCNDDLHISIGGASTNAEGIARVAASDIDEGSTDNCELARLQVRRQIDNNCLSSYAEVVLRAKFPSGFTKRPDASQPGVTYYLLAKDTVLVDEKGSFFSWWSDAVFFTCCDLSVDTTDKVLIELRATDRSGNMNTCWLRTLIEDKLAPVCEVHNATILCTELDFNPANPAEVSRRFGSAGQVVTLKDNCGATITETQKYTPGACGTGLIERVFTITDGSGLSTRCTQRIIIEEVNRYTVRFPRDLSNAECGVAPSDSLIQASQGCDVIAISRDTQRFEATDKECFKLLITYNIINWCEYDGKTQKPTIIPRDLDNDNNLNEYTHLEAGYETVSDLNRLYPLCGGDWAGIADNDGDASSVFVIRLFSETNGQKNAYPDQILVRGTCADRNIHVGFVSYRLKRTGDPKNPICYEPFCPPGNVNTICSSPVYANQCWTPGYYQYTQIIKVYDAIPPVITVISNDFDFCVYGDPATSCAGQVDVALQAADNCSLTEPELRSVKLLINRDPNQAVDPEDGVFQLLEVNDVCILRGQLPVGAHSYIIQFADGCGNLASKRVDFTVRDCKAPAPICINGVAIELMPVDLNGDGVVDGGMNTIRAVDMIASPVSDCSGPVTYSINRVGETPDRSKTILTVTCDDPLFETVPVEVHAWDALGNHDFCETYYVVEDLRDLCGSRGSGLISGLVLTEENEPVKDVAVRLSGQSEDSGLTSQSGSYSFRNLKEGYDYSVTPSRDGDYLNGVSTFDLVLMSKHILGVRPLTSPYKLIAADVNRSGSVTTLDIIALRKVILNVELQFKNNTSWRFVPAGFRFPNPANPFGSVFPEVLNINNLTGRVSKGDFVAIKVGDINSSAQPGNLTEPEARNSEGVITLNVQDEWMEAGKSYRIPISADRAGELEGLQLSLRADHPAVEITEIEGGLLQAGDYALFADAGLMTASWVNSKLSAYGVAGPRGTQPLFTLVLRAKAKANLKDVLSLSPLPTAVEAYGHDGQLFELNLRFNAGDNEAGYGFGLFQNRPNPYRESTVIGFTLPAEGFVTLEIHDGAGRRIERVSGVFAEGYQEIRLDSRAWKASGLLYYTLETPGFKATRPMMLAK